MKDGEHMLKYAKTARVGDHIRAYDFQPLPGRGECYIEGTVMEITDEPGFDAFRVMCEVDVFAGKSCNSRVGREIFVPHQIGFTEFENRVEKL
jgi:hypothetical protein